MATKNHSMENGMRAGGRTVADVPPGTWARVEVVLHVTGQKAGTWSCTVTTQGGDSVTADGLKVASRFRTLDWGLEPAVADFN